MRTWWAILLALFLIIFGLTMVTNFRVQASDIVEGVLAIGAAICLLLNK